MSHADTPVVETANDRFKSGFTSWLWGAMILATLAHFLVFLMSPEFGVDDITFGSRDVAVVEIPDEIEIPAPPASIARPAAPVIATAATDIDLTIPLTTLEANPVEALPPPPGQGADQAALAAAPTFTPMTVRPRLLNGKEIAALLVDYYPPLLRDSGIGGNVNVWFFIDETGRVVRTLIHQSSGFDAFDNAALRVADRMEFSPAFNRDDRVPVWVSLAIRFEVQR
jgi:TonB family protein